MNAVQTLLYALERKDPETFQHAVLVAHYARALAGELGLSAAEQRRVYLGALLHDIGKLCVKLELLRTQRLLDTQERSEISDHAHYGYALAQAYPELEPYLDIIRDHHERVDGQGYPSRKRAPAISLAARIVSVADAFEVMTSGRGYQARSTSTEALAELRRQAGRQFCARCVDAAFSLWSTPAPRYLYTGATPSARMLGI